LKCIILNADYPEYLSWLYSQNPGLEDQSYDQQMRVRNESLFGTVDFYSSNLTKLGVEAYDIYINNESMQGAWAAEHKLRTSVRQQYTNILQRGVSIAAKTPLRHLKSVVRPVLRSCHNQRNWLDDILAAQIKYFKPDIVLNEAMNWISSRFLQQIKPYTRLLVGQHAATKLRPENDYSVYDLVVSSFPPTLDWCRQKGISAEMNRLGFEPRVLSYLKGDDRTFDVTFIGSVFPGIHNSRAEFLETLCNRIERVKIWGTGVDHLSLSSPVRRCYMGPAWGLEMYQILGKSKITMNHHGDVAPYANNMRLYEATGVGTLLVTDWKDNLHEMFEPGKEVIAYKSSEECSELVQYYLSRIEERESIARAGQERTLAEHTYFQRMQELVEIVQKRL
jgi:spore maturation protein CgeB